jgi:hypothetical protein
MGANTRPAVAVRLQVSGSRFFGRRADTSSMAQLDAVVSPRPASGVPGALAAAAGAALVALVSTLALAIFAIFRAAGGTDGAGGDFLSFYAAGSIVRHGFTDGLYNPLVQSYVQHAAYPGELPHATGYPLPLFAAWLFAPLSELPYAAAYLLWLAANVAMLGALVVAMDRHMASVPQLPRRAFLAVFALSIPAATNIVFGQVDFIIFAAMFSAYLLMRDDREVLAGVVLAAILLKPQFLAGVVPMLLLWRQWRTLGALAIAGTALVALPALVSDPHAIAANVRFVLHYPGAGEDLQVNAGRMSNLRGLLVSIGGSDDTRLWLPPMLALAVATYAVAIVRWRLAERGRVAADQAYALAVMVPLLVSPHLHTQSLVLLFIPLAIALRGHFAPGDERARDFEHQSVVLTLLLALYAVLFGCWLSTALGFAPTALVVAAGFAACAWRWPHPEP